VAAMQSRKATKLLSACLLGLAVCTCGTLCAGFLRGVSFVSPVRFSTRDKTIVRGFKEDFDAWRASLTPEERALVQKQAQGEFNKKFRKSDEFKKDLPGEKVEAFSKILGKFFDNEAEDYKKRVGDEDA